MSMVDLNNKTILVTGAAGFIGSNLVKRIYQETTSATVIGIIFLITYLVSPLDLDNNEMNRERGGEPRKRYDDKTRKNDNRRLSRQMA